MSIVPPSSGSKSPAWSSACYVLHVRLLLGVFFWRWRRHVPPKCRLTSSGLTQSHFLGDRTIHNNHCENFKSYTFMCLRFIVLITARQMSVSNYSKKYIFFKMSLWVGAWGTTRSLGGFNLGSPGKIYRGYDRLVDGYGLKAMIRGLTWVSFVTNWISYDSILVDFIIVLCSLWAVS
jgi:hypothetical protein